MRVLLISYDLKGADDAGYASLFAAIKEQPWWHYLRSTWLVHTPKTPQQMADYLLPHLKTDKGDYLLVVEIKKGYQGWLPKDAWEWMNSKSF